VDGGRQAGVARDDYAEGGTVGGGQGRRVALLSTNRAPKRLALWFGKANMIRDAAPA
jgi:hypothetical protein